MGGCFVPSNDITNLYTISAGSTKSPSGYYQIVLSDYSSQLGSSVIVGVSGPASPSGLVYVTIHLDYGLKGSKATGWTKGAGTSTGTQACYGLYSGTCPGLVLDDPQSYSFNTPATTVTSTNHFKKDPGIAGLVQNTDGTPVPNMQVLILDSNGKTVATLTTDSDGVYAWQYKYTGKPTTYTVSVPAYKLQQSVTFKSNNFVIVNF
jgi:hypothetical protein